ncbi:leucine zipper putative tumor suppressor 1 [Oryzias latipes]|uniref:Leucine zipper, putative tumor suppressor 1 n=1 Tax=Oryzias latipes TaxID=8090 RepID=H2M473_ORYLA|nr:leucine zipper putative tumor suppressor 1 [Oryzias latipes]XP_023814317.1 leucine zipper putative tumor suppressor 1 [Oryzias latipes]
MGSVSSFINGNSLNSKHCKATDYRLKEGSGHHRKSGGCSLDSLLKCGFSQSSSSSNHHSKSLSHSRSGRSEDFFYIKVSNRPKPVYHKERAMEERVAKDGESGRRQQPKLLLMPGNMAERPSGKKSPAYSTAFSSVNPTGASCKEAGHNSLDHILCPLRKASSSNVGNKQETLGTLSDSGRNSMSSLPTQSTSSSLRVSTGTVGHGNSTSAVGNSLRKGQQSNFSQWNNGNNANYDYYKAGLNSSMLVFKESVDAGSPLHTNETSTLPEAAGGIRSPITTDESLIGHLEQRLLEKETELQELQVSFEEKETHTCQLFEERQLHCVEEMEGLKQQCSAKLRQASQNLEKSHQALQLQVCQLQADNKKLQEEISKLTQDKELVELRLRSYEKENTRLAPTLEETQWEVCQKSGEISLLKQQLRECQTDVSHKLNEIVGLRAALKESTARMEELDKLKKDHEGRLYSCTRELEVSQNELQRKKNEADCLREKVIQLEKDIEGMKEELVVDPESHNQKNSVEFLVHSESQDTERAIPASDFSIQKQEVEPKEPIPTETLQKEVDRLRQQLNEEKAAQKRQASSFEHERQTWNKEKDKVIKYQKQLQINYLHMHKKNQNLERRLKELTAELESRTELGICYGSGLQTYDDVIATEI